MIWLLRGYGSIYHAVAGHINEACTISRAKTLIIHSLEADIQINSRAVAIAIAEMANLNTEHSWIKKLLAPHGLEPRSSEGHFAPVHRCGPELTQLSDIRGHAPAMIPLHQSAGE